MASVLITTRYPGLGPTQRKNLMKLGLRYHSDYVDALARKRKPDAFARRIGVECAFCLDHGHVYPDGARRPSTYCGCKAGDALAGRTSRARVRRKAAPKTYAVQVIGAGVLPAPQDQQFGSWQRAFAVAKRMIHDLPGGCLIDVVHRTRDAEEYRPLARWEVSATEYWRVF